MRCQQKLRCMYPSFVVFHILHLILNNNNESSGTQPHLILPFHIRTQSTSTLNRPCPNPSPQHQPPREEQKRPRIIRSAGKKAKRWRHFQCRQKGTTTITTTTTTTTARPPNWPCSCHSHSHSLPPPPRLCRRLRDPMLRGIIIVSRGKLHMASSGFGLAMWSLLFLILTVEIISVGEAFYSLILKLESVRSTEDCAFIAFIAIAVLPPYVAMGSHTQDMTARENHSMPARAVAWLPQPLGSSSTWEMLF